MEPDATDLESSCEALDAALEGVGVRMLHDKANSSKACRWHTLTSDVAGRRMGYLLVTFGGEFPPASYGCTPSGGGPIKWDASKESLPQLMFRLGRWSEKVVRR